MKIPLAFFLFSLTSLSTQDLLSQELSLESIPPVVVKTVPESGAAAVDPALKEIRVTFSKPMKDGSWSWTTLSEDSFPEFAGKPHYLADGRTCVVPVKLKAGRFYATWLNTERYRNFKDAGGVPAVPYLLAFRTAGAGGVAAEAPQAGAAASPKPADAPLNDDQRLVQQWTERQFRGFFDNRNFSEMSASDRSELETQALGGLNGPAGREYYQAINTLGAMRSQKAVQPLLAIAADRAEKDCRDRWMAIRSLGLIGDKKVVPDIIHLVYHGNVNTRWWAQISLVRLTGKNFGSDWKAWGKWWAQQGAQPAFSEDFIRWYKDPQLSDPSKAAETLAQNDSKFLQQLRGN